VFSSHMVTKRLKALPETLLVGECEGISWASAKANRNPKGNRNVRKRIVSRLGRGDDNVLGGGVRYYDTQPAKCSE
jgi:hypothetical protein